MRTQHLMEAKTVRLTMALAAIAVINNAAFASQKFALAGYKMDGSPDITFGNGGKVVTNFPGASSAHASAMVVDSLSRLVVAGTADGLFALARYNSNGTLDTSFGDGGRVITDFTRINDNQYWNGANAIAMDGQGRIVVAGTMTGNIALARYSSDGSLDLTFDDDGLVKTNFQCDFDWCSKANGIVMDEAGRILVAGTAVRASPVSPSEPDEMFLLARYNENGSLDNTFNWDGLVNFNVFDEPCFNNGCEQRRTTEEEANGIAIDASGRIVVAGRVRYIAWNPSASEYNFWGAFMVLRYLPNGTLDSSFSDDVNSSEDGWTYIFETGYLSSAQTLPTSAALAVTIDKNEKILVAGYAVSGNGIASFALARLLSNGKLDSTFAGDGKDIITYWGWYPASAGAIKLDGAGNILAAGWAQTANARFALARWLPDGALDTTFGK